MIENGMEWWPKVPPTGVRERQLTRTLGTMVKVIVMYTVWLFFGSICSVQSFALYQ